MACKRTSPISQEKSGIAFSVTLSGCYWSADGDFSFIEMLTRKLYHVTIKYSYITTEGKSHQDTADYDWFRDALYSCASNYEYIGFQGQNRSL